MTKRLTALLIILQSFFITVTFAQSSGTQKEDKAYSYYDNFIEGNYVVIGAFEYVKNVVKYIDTVKEKGYNARYGYNPYRRLFYVFISKSDDLDEIRGLRNRIRATKGFGEAWVYSVSSKEEKQISKAIKSDPPADLPLETIENNTPSNSPINISSELKFAGVGKRITFDNILFHRNSSIAYNSSIEQLDEIYNWMISEPNTKIKIHGHTNGKFRGQIFIPNRRGDIERFFDLKIGSKIKEADDKRLSTERAKTVKDYLIAKGISKYRVEIKGWGKKAMLYPKRSKKSELNRRVEIEVTSN